MSKRGRWLSGVVALLVGAGCLAQTQAVRTDRRQKTANARSATYSLPRNQVWSALYSAVAEGCSITRESESRGYLETSWKQEHSDRRWKVNAEVVGEGPVRIVIKVQMEKRSRPSTYNAKTGLIEYGEWSGWSAGANWTKKEDELYVKVWEALGGTLEHSAVDALQEQSR